MVSALPVVSRELRVRRVQNWVLLGLMYGFFYMSRYNFSAVQAAIAEQFGWTHADFAWVVKAGTFVYGWAVFLNGPLADRMGGKRAILIGAAGAAVFNFLFGLCHLLLRQPAVMEGGQVVTPAEIAMGMSNSTALATFTVLWACNFYFQSFGALSIVKINAAWFHITERGKFAGIFGIMIQTGRTLAFMAGPAILRLLPWQYVFWIPAAILAAMFIIIYLGVENSPKDAGFDEFDTGDETPEEAREQASLGFVLRKVFARRAPWIIALSSMCIGMVRNAVDHWFPRYIHGVFHIPAKSLATFAPYQVASFLMPVAAILGGLAAGNASDRLFGSRRAPVIFIAFIGQAACLLLLRGSLYSAWSACATLILVSFFIQSAHSLVGGAASMDFGGRKAVATAAGLFDGAQYLAGAIVSDLLGRVLTSQVDPARPGAEFLYWPLVPLPFALLGALLISRLWHARPGRGGH
ncbi:MAG: MFS transporter [Myxococcales bacterium]|nr:MFS transporter [Myxococcota bacterium]MDW8283779.1 MFS transporter [Myxococcales bacterium]